MLIYTLPGNCSACGEELVESTTQIPGQEPFSVYICQNCAEGTHMAHHSQTDDPWMFDEYPDKYSMWELCVEAFKKTKRRADLWDDLKHVLKNGKWHDCRTIEAVLTNMDCMEYQIAKSEE